MNRHSEKPHRKNGRLRKAGLVRVAIGPLALGDLPKGAARPLKTEEKQALDRAMLTNAKAANAD